MSREPVILTKKKKLLDVETGEFVEMDYTQVHDFQKDSNFHKVFLDDFIKVLESTSEKAGKKLKVLCWILKKLKRNTNMLYYTYRQIADQTHISYATVAATMEKLQEADFLRREGTGKYMANPEIIFWGTYKRRHYAKNHYAKLGRKEEKKPEGKRLSGIKGQAGILEREAEKAAGQDGQKEMG